MVDPAIRFRAFDVDDNPPVNELWEPEQPFTLVSRLSCLSGVRVVNYAPQGPHFMVDHGRNHTHYIECDDEEAYNNVLRVLVEVALEWPTSDHRIRECPPEVFPVASDEFNNQWRSNMYINGIRYYRSDAREPRKFVCKWFAMMRIVTEEILSYEEMKQLMTFWRSALQLLATKTCIPDLEFLVIHVGCLKECTTAHYQNVFCIIAPDLSVVDPQLYVLTNLIAKFAHQYGSENESMSWIADSFDYSVYKSMRAILPGMFVNVGACRPNCPFCAVMHGRYIGPSKAVFRVSESGVEGVPHFAEDIMMRCSIVSGARIDNVPIDMVEIEGEPCVYEQPRGGSFLICPSVCPAPSIVELDEQDTAQLGSMLAGIVDENGIRPYASREVVNRIGFTKIINPFSRAEEPCIVANILPGAPYRRYCYIARCSHPKCRLSIVLFHSGQCTVYCNEPVCRQQFASNAVWFEVDAIGVERLYLLEEPR